MSRSSLLTRRRRLAAVVLLAPVLAVGTVLPAAAHVTVKPDSTYAGSFSALTFRVPNESGTAGTVKLVVTLPQDQPFRYISTKPVPGWSATTTEEKLPKPIESEGTTITKAIRTVTWTADQGTQIKPGEYQDFAISAGPLPASGTVTLPAQQTYSDGTVVNWDQPQPASGEEPEHPAPSFVIKPQEVAPSTAPASTPPQTAAASADPVARGLSGAALVVGLAAAVLAGLGLRRSRASRT